MSAKSGDFRFQNWYPRLSHVCLTSHWFKIQEDEIEELLLLQDEADRLDECPHLQILASRIQQAMERMGKDGVFVRVSPPDCNIMDHENSSGVFYSILKTEIKVQTAVMEDLQLIGSDFEDNAALVAIHRASVLSKVFRCGKDAVLYISKSKEYTKCFLEGRQAMMKNMSETEIDESSFYIILQAWNPNLLPEYSFRGFVKNGEMTACTQSHFGFVPSMLSHGQEIQDALSTFFVETLSPAMKKYPSYSFDIILDPATMAVKLIDISAFPPKSHTFLFDWENEEDRDMVLGTDDFETRVLSTPLPLTVDVIPEELRELASFCVEKTKQSKQSGRSSCVVS